MANFNINIKVKERASRNSDNTKTNLTGTRSEKIDGKDRVRERSPDRNSHHQEKHETNDKTEARKKELRVVNDHESQNEQLKLSEKDLQEEKDGEKPLGNKNKENNDNTNENMNEDNENTDDFVEEMEDVASLMGFGSFGSTKGKHVKGAKGGGTKIEKETEYRRYMNREKGSNRPLSPTR